MKSVYCAVRTGDLNKAVSMLSLKVNTQWKTVIALLDVEENQTHTQHLKILKVNDDLACWMFYKRTAAFTPRKYSWYSILLEAESTTGP
jgi:hypothetical protein